MFHLVHIQCATLHCERVQRVYTMIGMVKELMDLNFIVMYMHENYVIQNRL